MNKKKFLALLLAVLTLVGMIPMGLFSVAEMGETEPATTKTYSAYNRAELIDSLDVDTYPVATYPWAVFKYESGSWVFKYAKPNYVDNNSTKCSAHNKERRICAECTVGALTCAYALGGETLILLRSDYTIANQGHINEEKDTFFDDGIDCNFDNAGTKSGTVTIDIGTFTLNLYNEKGGYSKDPSTGEYKESARSITLINIEAKNATKLNFNVVAENNGEKQGTIIGGSSSIVNFKTQDRADRPSNAGKTVNVHMDNVRINTSRYLYDGKGVTVLSKSINAGIEFKNCVIDYSKHTAADGLLVNRTTIGIGTETNDIVFNGCSFILSNNKLRVSNPDHKMKVTMHNVQSVTYTAESSTGKGDTFGGYLADYGFYRCTEAEQDYPWLVLKKNGSYWETYGMYQIYSNTDDEVKYWDSEAEKMSSDAQKPKSATNALKAVQNLCDNSNNVEVAVVLLKDYAIGQNGIQIVLANGETYGDDSDKGEKLWYDAQQYNFGRIGGTVTLDLGGHTLNCNGKNVPLFNIDVKTVRDLTCVIKNGTVTNNSGSIVSLSPNTSASYAGLGAKNCTIKFENVDFTEIGASIINSSSSTNAESAPTWTATIDGGSITGKSGYRGEYFILNDPEGKVKPNKDLTINGTTINAGASNRFASAGINVTISDFAPQMALSLYDNIRPLFRVENGSFTDITLNYNGTDYAGVSGDTYTVFDSLPLVSPHLIGEKATVKVTATYLGTEVTSEVMEISIADYCYKAIRADITVVKAPEKKLIVDTLNYAAASQTWVAEQNGTSVGTLVNAELTNDEKALGTTTDVAINSTNINHTRDDNGTNVISAVCVSLNNGIRIKLTSNEYKLRVSCDKGEVGTISSFATDGKFYYAQLRVSAAELNVLYKFELLDAENNVVETFENYSFESYAYAVNKGEVAGTTDALKALVQAMMNYGKSAYDFTNGGN